jgi:hypothetical protein
MAPDGGVKDQEVSTSSSTAAARVARAPRPVSFKRAAIWHPMKHRRFRAGGTKKMAVASSPARAVAGAREVGEATTAAAAAMKTLTESGRDDEKGQVWGSWKR